MLLIPEKQAVIISKLDHARDQGILAATTNLKRQATLSPGAS